ncbi:MAG: hypothetical protein HY614_03825 [Candidatus Rokubacteria bacterium]|nr:hypothetical protein [Candidatus Rokubacteria bacterium]
MTSAGRGGRPTGLLRPPRGSLLVVALWAALGATAEAGHESPFYPSFYPQEITIEHLAPPAAAEVLAKNTLHAYVGADPFAPGAPPQNVRSVESLAGWVVVTINPALVPAERRCGSAGRVLAAIAGAGDAGWTFHPYPVTPYHADYLEHADLAETARARYRQAAGAGAGGGLRLVARGPLARKLLGPRAGEESGPWEAAVEEIRLDGLLAAHRTNLDGGVGPPWLKRGWFHAWLLLHASGDERDATHGRLVAGAAADERERLNLERGLVSRLTRRCDRVVAGFVTRREYVNDDYSNGVENVARDSQAGLRSHVFPRTVKLKDFPWNGWLHVGVESALAAAWNPIAGFSDDAGRLLWAALGDPAFFSEPGGGGWVPNRVTAVGVTADSPPAGLAVPTDAVAPEAGTGALRPVGAGKRARTRVLYRAVLSSFHDGSRMMVADLLYPFGFAARWSGRDGDAEVARATARVRERLVAVKVLKVETEVKNYGEDLKFTYEVPLVEVYLDHAAAADAAAVAVPWSTVPWPVGVLMEEAVRRGWAAFSADEARRRGVPWLDLARDRKLQERLVALAEQFRAGGAVPEPLRGFVTADEARARWERVLAFQKKHGHLLVTNGPYRLDRWSPTTAVLQVFRDLSYPLGVGWFDRYAIPLGAAVTDVADHGGRLELRAAVDVVTRFARSHEIARAPLRRNAEAEVVVCRYVVIGPDGAVARAGRARFDAGRFVVDLTGLGDPGTYRILVGLVVGGNTVHPEITMIEHRIQP